MKDNLATIASFDELVRETIAGPKQGFFDVKITFMIDEEIHGEIPEEEELVYVTIKPKRLQFVQDFIKTYTDLVTAEIVIDRNQYIHLIRHYRGLKAYVELRYMDERTEEIDDEIFYSDIFFVHIKDFVHLEEFYSGKELQDIPGGQNELVTMEIELINPIVYVLRKKELNFISRESDIENTLLTAMWYLGIKQTHFIPPVNRKIYEQIVVPPMCSLHDLVMRLQNSDTLGIYRQGCNYYYTNGIMYIYPMYDMEPEFEETEHVPITHIFKVREDIYTGLDNYHLYDEEEEIMLILLNRLEEQEKKTQSEIENMRTGRIFYRTEKLVDKSVILKDYELEAEDIKFDVDTTATDSMETDELSSTAVVKPSEHNYYPEASRVASSHLDRFSFNWLHARPLHFRPGFPVLIHYELPEDELNIRETDITAEVRPCLCEKAVYTLNKLKQTNDGNGVFDCTAKIQMTVLPNIEAKLE